jgi:hypothetical protein
LDTKELIVLVTTAAMHFLFKPVDFFRVLLLTTVGSGVDNDAGEHECRSEEERLERNFHCTMLVLRSIFSCLIVYSVAIYGKSTIDDKKQ